MTARQTDRIPVIMIRHAQSQWNLENRFTGWADPPLTSAGIAEAEQAGQYLREHGYRFDAVYSSRLRRAIQTLDILLEQIGQADIQRHEDWRLNERHYGQIQGLNKADMATQVGEQQVWRWRRSYAAKAEPLSPQDPRHPRHDPRYADVDPRLLPGVENLAQTRARIAGFWQEQIIPRLRRGERVLISSHGNSLRALLMELAGMSVTEVEGFEIPTAIPVLYEFDDRARPLSWRYLMEQHQHHSASATEIQPG